MAEKYRVVQWATGVVGSAALRGIIRHLRLELVGVKVYSDDKKGRDAGDLVGMDRTGVLATQGVEHIPLKFSSERLTPPALTGAK